MVAMNLALEVEMSKTSTPWSVRSATYRRWRDWSMSTTSKLASLPVTVGMDALVIETLEPQPARRSTAAIEKVSLTLPSRSQRLAAAGYSARR
jgi:hypothetical protein